MGGWWCDVVGGGGCGVSSGLCECVEWCLGGVCVGVMFEMVGGVWCGVCGVWCVVCCVLCVVCVLCGVCCVLCVVCGVCCVLCVVCCVLCVVCCAVSYPLLTLPTNRQVSLLCGSFYFSSPLASNPLAFPARR